MKTLRKILIGLVLVTSTLGLSGCFKSAPDEVGQTTIQRTFQGELDFLTSPFAGLDVTHVLVTDAKERVYLRSLLFDLDDYVNTDIRVSGPFVEEEVSERVVNVLTVEKLDLLSEVEDEDVGYDEQTFESSDLGISFAYNGNLLSRTSSGETVIFDGNEGANVVSVRLFEVSPELDAESYIQVNYSPEDFNEIQISNGAAALTNFPGVDGTLIYLVKRPDYFYKFTLVNSDSDSFSIYSTELEAIVNSVEFTEMDASEDPEEDETEDEDLPEGDGEEASDFPDFESVDLERQTIITNFEDSSFSLGLTDAIDETISYSFTDNGYFYVVYDSDNGERRALISYNGNSNFKLIAEFKPGTVSDWDLTSGENVAYDRPQTLILVGSGDSSSRELTIEPGYRYFESLPLGFGLQYPQNWYYARQEDAYNFSDKPIGEGDILVSVGESETDFASSPGTSVAGNVKKYVSGGQTRFYVDIDGESTYIVNGGSEHEAEMGVIANSIISVE